nr:calcium-dependent secretion activator-like isoform X1 [Parasteatoda tepidariorum]
MVEHVEIFWSLLAVHMDTLLAEQPPDTWDCFPVKMHHFSSENLCGGRFHQQLTFALQVVRYVDLMESSIAQSLHKGCEKERWEFKGFPLTVHPVAESQRHCCSTLEFFQKEFSFEKHGCITSEDLFWKLDALQSFIRDLHWPDEVFAKHLEQRLKLMACDMLVSYINRHGNSERWNCLRNSFIKELRDQTENHSFDGGRHRKKSPYFSDLLFLITVLASKTISNIPNGEKEERNDDSSEIPISSEGKKKKAGDGHF